jgi:hypothetical protein
MLRRIVDFDQDEERHWRALLECGHRRHVRHDPPLVAREWVLSSEGRDRMLGREIDCKLCEQEKAS